MPVDWQGERQCTFAKDSPLPSWSTLRTLGKRFRNELAVSLFLFSFYPQLELEEGHTGQRTTHAVFARLAIAATSQETFRSGGGEAAQECRQSGAGMCLPLAAARPIWSGVMGDCFCGGGQESFALLRPMRLLHGPERGHHERRCTGLCVIAQALASPSACRPRTARQAEPRKQCNAPQEDHPRRR